jgi:hypothetical protein
VGPWAWRTGGGASPAMTARRLPRALGLRRAGCSVGPTCTRVSSMCARRRFRRAQTALEVGEAMSSPRGCQWQAAELGRRLGVRQEQSGRSTYSRGRLVVSG